MRGGTFLSLLLQAFSRGGNVQKPDEPLPVESLVRQVHGPVQEIVKLRENGAEQTPRLAGAAPASGASYDPDQPMPPRFEVPKTAAVSGGSSADRKAIQALLEEIAVPPLRLPMMA